MITKEHTEQQATAAPVEALPPPHRRLHGAVAVVTGGAQGIGRAIAEELGRGGARVVIADLQEVHAPDVLAVKANVADPVQAAALMQQTIERFGRIDVLVNNAGITADHSLKNMTIEEWDRVISIDLSSCFYTVKAALPHFIRQQEGCIINISSFVGQAGNFGQANYAAAKAGVLGFTKTTALELARYNVTVNAICPGFIGTDMYEKIPPDAREAILKRIPLGRVGKPEEIARCVRYLIEDGQYITGQGISINGGIYM